MTQTKLPCRFVTFLPNGKNNQLGLRQRDDYRPTICRRKICVDLENFRLPSVHNSANSSSSANRPIGQLIHDLMMGIDTEHTGHEDVRKFGMHIISTVYATGCKGIWAYLNVPDWRAALAAVKCSCMSRIPIADFNRLYLSSTSFQRF